MTAQVSAQQYFSKAVHCSVSGAIIRKAGAVPLNKACAGTDVSDAVSAQRRALSKQFRLSRYGQRASLREKFYHQTAGTKKEDFQRDLLKTGLLQTRTNASSAADA